MSHDLSKQERYSNNAKYFYRAASAIVVKSQNLTERGKVLKGLVDFLMWTVSQKISTRVRQTAKFLNTRVQQEL